MEIRLTVNEQVALQSMAYREKRNARAQAEWLVRRALEAAALIVGDTHRAEVAAPTTPQAGQEAAHGH